MSIWLQKRLAVWMGVSLCGGALVWNVGASRAQNETGKTTRQLLTRDKATTNFGAIMRYLFRANAPTVTNPSGILDPVSRKSKKQLDYRVGDLLEEMALQWKQPHTPALVLIEEENGWGVDLIETYAKWNNLQGVATTKAIFKITGTIVEDLPRDERFNRHVCQSNLKQIALGIAQYNQDYDEIFPPAKKWIDVLQPYVKNEATFNCPSIPKAKRYGYAYNSKLSSKDQLNLADKWKIISLYETSILKRNAYGTGENLAFRHQNGANYAFADGHVKWFPKNQTPSFKLKP